MEMALCEILMMKYIWDFPIEVNNMLLIYVNFF